jgi:DNA-binding NarL/FixJ family response regulator
MTSGQQSYPWPASKDMSSTCPTCGHQGGRWGITKREAEILGLLAAGLSNASIASWIGVSMRTVEHHINALFRKMLTDTDNVAVHRRVKVVLMYLEHIQSEHGHTG